LGALGTKWLLHDFPSLVRLVGGGAVFAIIYVAAVLFLRILDTEEKEMINRYLRKVPGVPVLT
jgi:hypothetical protein